MKNENSNPEFLVCSCCGNGLRDTAEQNTYHGRVPYPSDRGFGMCRECGGDDSVPVADKTEEAARKRMGWGMAAFVDARIDILQKKLNPANKAKFNAMPYVAKANIVLKMVESGAMI